MADDTPEVRNILFVELAAVESELAVETHESFPTTLPVFIVGDYFHWSVAQQSASQALTKTPDGVPACRATDISTRWSASERRHVQAPIPKFVPNATPSEEARRFVRNYHLSRFPVSLLRFTVDEKGISRDICVCKEAGLGLDKEAFNTVTKYRFEPGMFSGKPIRERIAIQVDFGSF